MVNYRLRFELPKHLQAEAMIRLTGDEESVDEMVATLRKDPQPDENGVDGLLLFLNGMVFDEKGIEGFLLMFGRIDEVQTWEFIKQRILEDGGIRLELKDVPVQLIEPTNEPVTKRIRPLQ